MSRLKSSQFAARAVRSLGAALLLAAGCVPPAWAVLDCDIDGVSVNPSNGHTTAGKTGLMRCRDRDTGRLQREEELREGRSIGLQRSYKDGVLWRERTVNERGNGEGLQRTYAATPGANNPLVLEETLRDGSAVGLVRAWHRNGQLQRASFYGDDRREEAMVAYNEQGQPAELRCALRPRLSPSVDDAALCGHAGAAATVTLHAADGRLRGRVTHTRGLRTRAEMLWDTGKPQELEEQTDDELSLQSFNREGVKRREQRWQIVQSAESRTRRVAVSDHEFAESGARVRERRWVPDGAGARLVLDAQWYLNGQPRQRTEYQSIDGEARRRQQQFHDNGQLRSEGWWLGPAARERPTGVHRHFTERGALALERHYDDRGRISREREFDPDGRMLRDDELLPDGSRKAFTP